MGPVLKTYVVSWALKKQLSNCACVLKYWLAKLRYS